MPRPAVTALPYELLAHIFRFISPYCDSDYNEATHIRALATISAVCSVWRQVAIGTADLWTKITIGRRFSPDESDDTIVERTTAFLQRSKMATLDLDIYLTIDESMWAAIWSAVVPHLERCHSLSIHLDRDTENVSVMEAIQAASFPLLKHFSLSDSRQRFSYGGAHPPPTPTAPSLQSLRLDMHRPEEFFPFLAHYPNVVTLSVDYFASSPMPMHMRMVLPELRTLHTRHLSLLYTITTPALTTIIFEAMVSRNWALPLGMDFKELRLVRFHDCNLSITDDFTVFLTVARMIERLELDNCDGAHQLLSKLLVGRASQEALDSHSHELDSLTNFDDNKDHPNDQSRFPLPFLTHISIANHTYKYRNLTANVLYKLLSTRSSLHVTCDIKQLRDQFKYPGSQNDDEDGSITYFGDRLVIND